MLNNSKKYYSMQTLIDNNGKSNAILNAWQFPENSKIQLFYYCCQCQSLQDTILFLSVHSSAKHAWFLNLCWILYFQTNETEIEINLIHVGMCFWIVLNKAKIELTFHHMNKIMVCYNYCWIQTIIFHFSEYVNFQFFLPWQIVFHKHWMNWFSSWDAWLQMKIHSKF